MDENHTRNDQLRSWHDRLLPNLASGSETSETIRLHQGAIHFGVALVLIGVVATVFVCISHLSNLQKLRRGETPVPAFWSLSIIIAVLLALLALGGLWFFYIH